MINFQGKEMLMDVISYTDISEFCEAALGELLLSEIENNLPIGILERAIRNGDETGNWFMARVAEDSSARLVALMTPPHNLILASPDRSADPSALRALSDFIGNETRVPGVLGENELAIAFAEVYTSKAGVAYKIKTNERLYRLDKVEDVALIGTLRRAEDRDFHYLPYWMKGFYDDCFEETADLDADNTQKSVGRGALYVLEYEGMPVSLAGTTRKMPNGRSVGPVYTPPYLRGRGYATSCVAQLSRLLLDQGNRYCVLFTDLANPVSNSIYQQIGYRPVCDFAEISFLLPGAEDL